LSSNEREPDATVTRMVSASRRKNVIDIERPPGAASVYDPACGTGSTQRSSTPRMARSQVPFSPVHERAPSTLIPSATPPASGVWVRSPVPWPVRLSERRVQVRSCLMRRLCSDALQVTVAEPSTLTRWFLRPTQA